MKPRLLALWRMRQAGDLNLLHLLLGYLTPIRTSGRNYILYCLRRSGIDTTGFPRACAQELADDAIRFRKDMAKRMRRSWRQDVVSGLNLNAENVVRILKGYKEQYEGYERYEEILRRHGVVVPPKISN